MKNIQWILLPLMAVSLQAASPSNTTCIAMVQNAVNAIDLLNGVVAEANSQIDYITHTTVPEVLDTIGELQNGTIPEIVNALNGIKEQVRQTTEMIESRTDRTYLVGTIALSSFAFVIVGAVTLGLYRFGVWKAQQCRAARIQALALAQAPGHELIQALAQAQIVMTALAEALITTQDRQYQQAQTLFGTGATPLVQVNR